MPAGKHPANRGPMSVKGWRPTDLGAFVRYASSGVALTPDPSTERRWLCPVPFGRGGPQERRSSGAGPWIPGSPSGQSQRSSVPPGTGGSGEGTGQWDLSCRWVLCKLCRSVHPDLLPGPSRPVCTGRLRLVTCRELDSRAGNLATINFVFPLCFTLCLGEVGLLGIKASQDTQLPLSPAPGRGQDSSPRHTPEDQHSRPLPQKTSWKNKGRASLLAKQTGELQD